MGSKLDWLGNALWMPYSPYLCLLCIWLISISGGNHVQTVYFHTLTVYRVCCTEAMDHVSSETCDMVITNVYYLEFGAYSIMGSHGHTFHMHVSQQNRNAMKKAWEKLSTYLSHLLTSVTQNKKSHVKSATCSRFFQNIFETLLVHLYLSPVNFLWWSHH